MKHKTSELSGDLLDAAVASASGDRRYPVPGFSVQWGHGGPIIEREAIKIAPVFFEVSPEFGFDVEFWEATHGRTGIMSSGSTPLIAAMRAYVIAKLGEEVEL